MAQTAIAAPAPTETEEKFGKYRLRRKIGVGGMAVVYLASLDGPDGFRKDLVVKRIHPHLSGLAEFAQMFAAEAKLAALLHHPHIAQVYEYGSIDDCAYLAMEYVEGRSLDALVRAAAKRGVVLGPDVATQIGVQVCEALDYAHELRDPDGKWLGLVHRDVSLSNLLVGSDGAVKLLDFGIAKITQGPSLTQAGTLKGKLAYMAPEQLAGRVDRRSDLFSLAVVLYEISVGRRLFKRGTDAETIAALMRAEVPRPSDMIPGFPRELENVLERALEADPERRISTAAEMGDALEACARARGISAHRKDLARALAALPIEVERSSHSMTPPSSSGMREREDLSDPVGSIKTLTPPAPEESAGVDPLWVIAGISGAILATIGIWWLVLS